MILATRTASATALLRVAGTARGALVIRAAARTTSTTALQRVAGAPRGALVILAVRTTSATARHAPPAALCAARA